MFNLPNECCLLSQHRPAVYADGWVDRVEAHALHSCGIDWAARPCKRKLEFCKSVFLSEGPFYIYLLSVGQGERALLGQ